MKKRLFLLTALSATLGFNSTSIANDQASAAQTDSSQASPLPVDSAPGGQFRASRLLGINVTSKGGESLGTVQDLVIDPVSGKIRFALVGKGFMAGAGETVLPIPWQAVQVQAERKFVLNIDEQKMKSAPAWRASELEEPEYIVRIYRFYELAPENEAVGGTGAQNQSGQATGSSEDEQGSHKDPTTRPQP